jgi:hypothetical protein
MKRRIAVLAVLLTIIVLVGTEVIGVAEANPVPWQFTPNLEKPSLTVMGPQNLTAYPTYNIPITYSVVKPSSWDATYWYWQYIGEIASVDVRMDGEPVAYYTKSQDVTYQVGSNKTVYHSESEKNLLNNTISLNQTTIGSHNLSITVLSYTYYKGPLYSNTDTNSSTTSNGQPIHQHPIIVSATMSFTMNSNGLITIAPTPTPTLTPTVEPSTSASENPSNAFSSSNLAIISLVIIVAVAVLVSLVYFKRRRGKQ